MNNLESKDELKDSIEFLNLMRTHVIYSVSLPEDVKKASKIFIIEAEKNMRTLFSERIMYVRDLQKDTDDYKLAEAVCKLDFEFFKEVMSKVNDPQMADVLKGILEPT